VDGIARALAVPEPAVREVWPMLVNKYKNAAGRDEKCEVLNAIKGAKDGFACALAASASDTEMRDLVDLVRDQSNGITRVLMLSALRRSKKSEAILALKELANDPDLKNEIASWRKI
jgi:hypothetical protein